MADSCICVLAYPGHPRTKKPKHDELIVEVSVTIGAVYKKPVRKVSPKIHWSSKKTFHHSHQAILSSDRQSIISAMIETLNMPFPMHESNILWGALDFPADDRTPPNFESLDKIKTRLSDLARACAENGKTGYMDIRIQKVERLSPKDYQKLLDDGRESKGSGKTPGPLDNWIRQNIIDMNLHRINCLGLIQRLCLESPADNKYFGLESVTIREGTDEEGCSICLKGLKKYTEAIKMPCAHIFHGFCILKWIAVRPSCPFCRSELCGSREGRVE